MKKPVVAPTPPKQTLAEQQSAFTAEGSPPPGKVSTSVPARAPEPGKGSPPAKSALRHLGTAARPG